MFQLTKEQKTALLANGRRHGAGQDIDPLPVVKLFLTGTAMTWLLTELEPEDEDTAFGLCDLGMGYPELGYVSLAELGNVRNALRLGVEIDATFKATKPLSAYTDEARKHQAIQA